jgi:DNA-binding transcriptional ArsR family regulator
MAKYRSGGGEAGRDSLDPGPPMDNHVVVDTLGLSLAALSDPTRRAILARLAGGPATVGDLGAPLRMSQQAVSKHLAVLERARLVAKRREGRLRVCSLDPAPLREVEAWIGDVRGLWKRRFDALESVLREPGRRGGRHGRR